MPYYYQCFGLKLQSEFPCPLPASSENSVYDVQIKLGKVPPSLPNSQNPEAWCQANTHQLLLKIKDVANFLIEHGHTITVEPIGTDVDFINVFILGSAMGGILHQRGYLVMHANAVVINQQATLIAAPQGYGKSTLAAAFLKSGYSLLADDVCAITFNDQQPFVHPSYPQIKLCADVLNHFGYDPSNLQPIGHKTNKYYVPMQQHFNLDPVPVKQMVILDKADCAHYNWQRINGRHKLKAVLDNTYRPLFIDLQGLTSQYFDHCAKLIKNIPLFHLTRPTTGFSAFELVTEITQQINHEERITA